MAEAVKVIVRCRPVNQREIDLHCNTVINMISTRGQCTIQNPSDTKAPPKVFFFDGAYFTDSTTENIYSDIAYPLVEGVTEGYNGTIFAYGQTGCGKSFTMQGIPNPPTQKGIIPRAFEHIFETISVTDKAKYLVHATYLEIYNEEIRDLLAKDVKAKLDLKEHPEKGVYVAGLSMHKVTNVKDCQVVMERGWKNRATGATLMNADSSRSHSIFTIYLEMAETDNLGEDHIRAGKLNLVDLAGSERQSKTGSTGDRLKEATKINLSLSALGNVISALVDAKSKHIPYRDSKLTRMLQDSLGGNTKTLMVACLSPADNNYDESLSSLRYANRAKNIQNKPKINEDPKDALLREYQLEIDRLKLMLMGQIPVNLQGTQAVVQPTANIEQERIEIEMEKEKIKKEYELRLREKEDQYEAEAADKAKLQEDMRKLRNYYDSQMASLEERDRHLPPTSQVLGGLAESAEEMVQMSTPHDAAARTAAPGVTTMAAMAAVSGAPRCVNGQEQDLPPPDMASSSAAAGTGGVLIVNREGALTPDEQYTSSSQPSQMAVHVRSSSSTQVAPPAAAIAVPAGLIPGGVGQMSQAEVLMRLQMLEAGMVGGELVNNKEIQERRRGRKKYAEERKNRLAEANLDLEDEGIMVGIYEGIQDELRAKNKLLAREKQKVTSMEQEILDLQSEFEQDRIDYLDTIRKQEHQVLLLQSILDRVQPCIRRDCNYSNLDKIKNIAKWDEDANEWRIPALTLERTQLPSAHSGSITSAPANSSHQGPLPPEDDDRYYQRLAHKADPSKEYFTSRRAQELIATNNRVSARPSGSIASPQGGGVAGMHLNEHRAATVHGQLGGGGLMDHSGGVGGGGDEGSLLRRPTRLEALPTPQTAGRKGRRKRAD